MPSGELPLYYWDACVPLSYINAVPDRLPHIDAFMSKSGVDFRLITSVLSITEVAFAASEQVNGVLDPSVEERISKLWNASSPIRIVELYELIALKAQQLMRAAIKNRWSLKPADAIHLATADQLKVSAFHTYDEPLFKYSDLTETKFPINFPISASPHLLLLPHTEESVATTGHQGTE